MTVDVTISLLVGFVALLLAALAWKRAPSASVTTQLRTTLDWLLAQNQTQAVAIAGYVDRIDLLEREVGRLRNDLADAKALIRSLQAHL